MNTSAFRFNATASADEIMGAMHQHGCAIIENVLDGTFLAELNEQAAPHLEAIRTDEKNPFNGNATKRFGGLAYLVPKSRDLIMHPLIGSLLQLVYPTAAPTHKVTFTGVMHVMAGQKIQVGHRDNYPFMNPCHPLVFATMWAATDFTRENGATLFVPGSHKWKDKREPTREEICVAEMPAGSLLLYYANLIHSAGRSVAGVRSGVSIQYAPGWLQQEENFALMAMLTGFGLEGLRSLDERLLEMLGCQPYARNTGEVNSRHPIDYVKNDGTQRRLDDPRKSYANGVTHELYFTLGDKPREEDPYYDLSLIYDAAA